MPSSKVFLITEKFQYVVNRENAGAYISALARDDMFGRYVETGIREHGSRKDSDVRLAARLATKLDAEASAKISQPSFSFVAVSFSTSEVLHNEVAALRQEIKRRKVYSKLNSFCVGEKL